mmetsp:Transcript_10236/g.17230  ORF Transcript_10236/g.17230 Transcript_10236/m.17230 type:complete len:156 (+) Transcript_10236:926-1393(+)
MVKLYNEQEGELLRMALKGDQNPYQKSLGFRLRSRPNANTILVNHESPLRYNEKKRDQESDLKRAGMSMALGTPKSGFKTGKVDSNINMLDTNPFSTTQRKQTSKATMYGKVDLQEKVMEQTMRLKKQYKEKNFEEKVKLVTQQIMDSLRHTPSN